MVYMGAAGSWAAGHKFYGGITSLIIVSFGLLLALAFALLSMRQASRVMLSRSSWRKLFKLIRR